MKKKPESNPDPVARREALASDVEQFLNSGKEIEQIPSGVSSYSPQGPVKSLNAQKSGQANASTSTDANADAKTDPATDPSTDSATATTTEPSAEPSTEQAAEVPVQEEAAAK